MVVFWCCNQDPVAFRNELLHILDCRRTRRAVKILVVERDLFESHYVEGHRSRCTSRESPKKGCAERSFPAAPRNPANSNLLLCCQVCLRGFHAHSSD